MPRKGEYKYTSQELDQRVDDYFTFCDERARKPTRPGLAHWLQVDEKSLDNWEDNDGNKYGDLSPTTPGHSTIIKRAMLRIRDGLEQRTDTMALFLLKQKRYGGYIDRPAQDGGGAVQVAISFGAAGAEKARKFAK